MPSIDKTKQPSSTSTSSSFAASLLALGNIAGYSVDAVLGSGTYGVVLRASHGASGGTACALKVFKTPLMRTESASLDSAWASLTTEARALELLGATATATTTATSTALASSSSSSSSASAAASLSSAPSGIPRLFEYGILKANSRSKGPGGAAGEGGEGNSSVDATNGDSERQEEAEDDGAGDERNSPSPAAAAKAAASPSGKDPSPDAVCYAWMSTELLGSDLWHLMRDTKQRAKAKAASSSGGGCTAAAAASKDEAQRCACKLSCRALLSEVAPAMLSALEQVHARGLVHRDVKLDNFAASATSVGKGGGGEKGGKIAPSAYLLDFGGVAAAPSLAAGSETVDRASKGKKTCFFGTPEYCSSAAFTGELPPTPAQDVEALGYCLLELWGGGRLPWGEAFRARRETATERWSSRHCACFSAAVVEDSLSSAARIAARWASSVACSAARWVSSEACSAERWASSAASSVHPAVAARRRRTARTAPPGR